MARLVGNPAPYFKASALVNGQNKEISLDDYKGKWKVLFFYPLDFTFVCPTEIAEFNKNFENFSDRDTILLGASTDSEFVHLAWRKDHEDLRDLQFPMIADTSKSLAEALGILEANEKIAYRATFIIDPQGIVRWLNIKSLKQCFMLFIGHCREG